MNIPSEKYTPDFKGYLTYPANPRMKKLLLEEHFKKISFISIGTSECQNVRVKPKLASIIEKIGGKVEIKNMKVFEGKNQLFGIDVLIRKISEENELKALLIRVTGKNLPEIFEKMNKIKTQFTEYGITHTECIWGGEFGGKL